MWETNSGVFKLSLIYWFVLVQIVICFGYNVMQNVSMDGPVKNYLDSITNVFCKHLRLEDSWPVIYLTLKIIRLKIAWHKKAVQEIYNTTKYWF